MGRPSEAKWSSLAIGEDIRRKNQRPGVYGKPKWYAFILRGNLDLTLSPQRSYLHRNCWRESFAHLQRRNSGPGDSGTTAMWWRLDNLVFSGELFFFFFLGSFADEPNCGRPLGMRIDKEGYLVLIDTYLGLFRINVATGLLFCC